MRTRRPPRPRAAPHDSPYESGVYPPIHPRRHSRHAAKEGGTVQFQRGAATCAAVLVLSGGLVACGGTEATDPTTKATPTDRSTTSPSSMTSSSEGEVAEPPEGARAQTNEGATAFTEWYLDQVGESLKTADSATVRAYSSGCAFCDEIADTVDQFAEDGIAADKNPYSLTVDSATSRTDAGYRVEVSLHISEYRKVASDGSKGPTVNPSSITMVTDARWDGEGWQIHEVVRTE